MSILVGVLVSILVGGFGIFGGGAWVDFLFLDWLFCWGNISETVLLAVWAWMIAWLWFGL